MVGYVLRVVRTSIMRRNVKSEWTQTQILCIFPACAVFIVCTGHKGQITQLPVHGSIVCEMVSKRRKKPNIPWQNKINKYCIFYMKKLIRVFWIHEASFRKLTIIAITITIVLNSHVKDELFWNLLHTEMFLVKPQLHKFHLMFSKHDYYYYYWVSKYFLISC